jgi:hypothetical protein
MRMSLANSMALLVIILVVLFTAMEYGPAGQHHRKTRAASLQNRSLLGYGLAEVGCASILPEIPVVSASKRFQVVTVADHETVLDAVALDEARGRLGGING